MHSPSCTNAHHVVTDLKVSGKFENKKKKISWTEQFFHNIKNVWPHRWLILRS